MIVGGASSAWADKTTKSETFIFSTSGCSGWSTDNAGSYCGGYGNKKNNYYVANASITNFKDVDFSKVTTPSVTIYVTALTNGGTNQYTVSLIDKDGKVVGTPVVKSSGMGSGTNSGSADESSVVLTPVSGTTGYRIDFLLKSAITQTRYTLTYEPAPAKTASNLTITNTENAINLAIGGTTTGDITYTTSSDGDMHFTSNDTSVATVDEDGTVTAVAEGSTTITVSQDEGTSYAASSNLSVTVNVSDARTAVGSITAISPTTVYVGQIDDFTLTQSMTGDVSSYAWSLEDGEDEYLILDDETFEGLKEGNVTVTVTATPTDASTYKPVTASFPVNVEYKYAAPSLPAEAVFFSTKSITIPAVAGADVYYTLDGSTPTKSSTKYTEAFELSATKTVNAIAIDEDGCVSPVSSATYTKEAVFDLAGSDVEFLGSTISFDDSGSGYNGGADRTGTITNSGATKSINISGSNIMMNSSAVQFKSGSGTMTTQWIENGDKNLSITPTFSGGTLDYEIAYANGSDASSGSFTTNVAVIPNSLPCKITMTSSSGTILLTKLTLTTLKDPVATEVAITDPGTLAKDATGTFAYTANNEETNTASWTSATTSVITITNEATGAYTAAGRGTSKITLTLTPTDATTYRAVTAQRTITVTAPVEVSASDVEMTYGDAAKAIGATTSAGYAGTLTYASGNTSIATVDASGNVTAVAAGTTTITISAPADDAHYYTAGDDKEITVTVAAPEGLTTAKPSTPVEVTRYTLLSNSLPTGWTGDGNIWSGSSSYGAVTAAGTIGNSYDLTTPSINLNGSYTAASVTFQHTGNQTFSTTGTGRADACQLFVTDGITETQLTINTMFAGNNWTYVTNTTDLTDYIGKTIQLIFRYTPSSGNQGKWEVKNFQVNATPDGTESVTVSESGYGTYCSLYPLDLDKLDSKVKAYTVTAVTSSSVTFTEIKGTIKGGVPFILYGEEGDYTIPSAASSTVPAGNNLSGTLAPTYLTQINGDYTNFALSASNGDFRLIPSSGMTFPANKAYLPVLTDVISSGSARLAIIFDDDQTTTIQGVSVRKTAPDTYYNMKGQRVDNPKKGGVYVKNGKKVIFK